MMQYRPTWIEIHLPAIAANVQRLRAHLGNGTRLMAVVKADGYGHGAAQVAACALAHGASALGVATVEEGAQLRDAGIDVPILVLGAIDDFSAQAVAAYGLAQTVTDPRAVQWLARAGRETGQRIPVHIKVDTGMGRIGVRSTQAFALIIQSILEAPSLALEGLFTHFATADGDLGYLHMQQARFAPYVEMLRKAAPGVLVHAANSAALLRCPQAHYQMVRPGIALFLPMQLPDGPAEGFGQAMRWVTRGVYIKQVEPGETISYGRAFTARRTTTVMTIPVGYADGYHRAIGGTGAALVRGCRAPVIGRVCMDQAMLDVTDIPGVSLEDRVVLLGSQGAQQISAQEMADWCGLIDYEVLLSPSKRVPRIYIGEESPP